MPDRKDTSEVGGGRRPSSRAPEAEARIKQAVIATVAERGFSDLSKEAICARAGVPSATFDRRWSSAEYALLEALDERARLPRLPNTGSVMDDLVAYARAYYDSCSDPEFSAFMFSVMAQMRAEPGLRARLEPGFESRRSTNRSVIARGVERGELPPGTDADLILDEVLALVMSWMGAGSAPPDWAIRLAIEAVIKPVEVH